mgnify:CR=1 FL=1
MTKYNARPVMGIMAICLWFFFMYELYFLVGTDRQGCISPSILTIASFFLVITGVINTSTMINNGNSSILLGIGMFAITSGIMFPDFYKYIVSVGSLFVILSAYNKMYEERASSFGYSQTPLDTYRQINQPIFSSLNSSGGMARHPLPRIPLNYPRPSGIQGGV